MINMFQMHNEQSVFMLKIKNLEIAWNLDATSQKFCRSRNPS